MANAPLNLETMKSVDVSKKIDPVEAKSLNKLSLTGKVKTNLENNIKIKLDPITSKSVKDVVEAIKKANLSADEGQAIAGKDIKFTLGGKQYKILRWSEAAAVIQAYVKSTTNSSDILEWYKIDGKIWGTTLKAIETRKLQEVEKITDETKKNVDKIKKDIENPLSKTRITDEIAEYLENWINAIDVLATLKASAKPSYITIVTRWLRSGLLDGNYLPKDMEIDAAKKTLVIAWDLKAEGLSNRRYKTSIDLNKIVNPLKTSEIDPDKFVLELCLALKDLVTQNETAVEKNKLNAIEARRKALRGQFDFTTKVEPVSSSYATKAIKDIKNDITKLNAIITDFNKIYPANSIVRDKALKDKITASLNKDKADYTAALTRYNLLNTYLKTFETDNQKIRFFKDGYELSSEDFADKYQNLTTAETQNLKEKAVKYQALIKTPAHKKAYFDAKKQTAYADIVKQIDYVITRY